MDIYIDYFLDLLAYIKKNAQISKTYLFKEQGAGLQCVLVPESLTPEGPEAGPQVQGRSISITVRLSAPHDNWKQLFQYMGRIEQIFQNCVTENNELKIKYHLTLGAWSRSEDESNLIYENSLEVRCVRINNN